MTHPQDKNACPQQENPKQSAAAQGAKNETAAQSPDARSDAAIPCLACAKNQTQNAGTGNSHALQQATAQQATPQQTDFIDTAFGLVCSPPLCKAALWALPFSYLLGWFYIRWLLLSSGGVFYGWAVPVFCLAFFGQAELLMRMQQRAPNTESRVWLGFCFVLALNMTLQSRYLQAGANSLYVWQIYALHAGAAYWVVCRAGLLSQGRSGAFIAIDGFRALIGLPFGNFFLRLGNLFRGAKKAVVAGCKKSVKKQLPVVLTLLMALPLFWLALQLLTGADDGFRQLISSLRFEFTLPQTLAQNVWCWVIGLPVGAYLYGLVMGALKQTLRPGQAQAICSKAETLRLAPKSGLVAALAAFCGLYLTFFAVQAGYLLSGFTGRLPAGFTAAEYARRGFFELCAIVVLNFGLLVLCAKLSRHPVRSLPLVRGLCVGLCAANLVFACISFSKMYLYISRFGFTEKRVLSAWFTLVLVVLTLFAVVSLCRPFAAVRWAVFAAAALFLLLCASQPAVWISAANNALQQSGQITIIRPFVPQAEVFSETTFMP